MSRDVSSQSNIAISKTTDQDGSFNRKPSTFRDVIEKGGKHEPEKGRYHLYVSYACPWAHRTLIMRKLKGLEDFIDVTVVSPRMGEHGWPFANVDPYPGAGPDPVAGAEHIKDLYLKVQPDYSGRFTVPVLFDKKTSQIVNNESSEIIRILNTAFNELLPADKAALDFYPEQLRSEIDASHEWIYPTINNGVYRSGFATSQGAYETAVKALFESLDRVEGMLESQKASAANSKGEVFLIGDRLTESDVRLYTTIVRFDPVYHGHFKCNYRTIRDGYPNIHKWMQNLYWNYPAFKDTTNFDHIKTHYYWSHPHINPTRVVPLGPIPNIRPL
ncbi:glutathione S-transferase [Serendipita vermifera]|nr:glutathione S-transferase [Serendipita vermifera]